MDEDKYKPGKDSSSVKVLKPVFGSTGYPKPPLVDTKQSHNAANTALQAISVGQGLSTALDARLELGLETHSELRLQTMLSMQSDALQSAFISPLPMLPADNRGRSWSRLSPTDGELMDSTPSIPQVNINNLTLILIIVILSMTMLCYPIS